MGNLTSTLTQINSTLSTINSIAGGVQVLTGYDSGAELNKLKQDQAMRELRAKQAQEEAQASRDADLERKTIATEAAQAEDARRRALKRAMAKQNASRGASGASAGGSGEAVLLGLYNESEDEKKDREQIDQLRYNALNNSLQSINEKNVLEQTQLANRQRLERVVNGY